MSSACVKGVTVKSGNVLARHGILPAIVVNPLFDPSTITQIKQYRLVRELGRGAMGTVYEGVDARDGSRVAVKVLKPELVAADPTFRDRFEREAHVAALLRSPYTVHLNDFGFANGLYFLVMEYVDGESLSQALEGGPMDPAKALHVAIAVARALEEAAARGVVHRDIKPDNIMLAQDGVVKVADFGIARQEGGAGATIVGGYVGTPAYSAPEQTRGDVDTRTDIYALGATLYCMLVGPPALHGQLRPRNPPAAPVLARADVAAGQYARLDYQPDPPVPRKGPARPLSEPLGAGRRARACCARAGRRGAPGAPGRGRTGRRATRQGRSHWRQRRAPGTGSSSDVTSTHDESEPVVAAAALHETHDSAVPALPETDDTHDDTAIPVRSRDGRHPR